MTNLLGLTEGKEIAQALTSMSICNKKTKIGNPCDWNGVRCTDDLITDIHWKKGFNVQIADIAWLPSGLMVLNVFNADIDSMIDTRMLPQGLTDCDMTNCGLYGSIELRTLPPELKCFKLKYNEFSGTVKLVDLPKDLRQLDLSLSPLKAVVVRNKNLPKTLEFVKFYNPLKRIRFICIDAKKVDNRVYIAQYDSISSSSISSESFDYTSSESYTCSTTEDSE